MDAGLRPGGMRDAPADSGALHREKRGERATRGAQRKERAARCGAARLAHIPQHWLRPGLEALRAHEEPAGVSKRQRRASCSTLETRRL